MNCKKCGKVLRAGVQRCPYCGTVVPAPGKRTDTGFNWDLKDDSSGSGSGSRRPAPGKTKSDLTFDWNTEKRASGDTNRSGLQKANRWKEPEEARQLFTFDTEHEKLQRQVNRKMDDLAASKPAPAIEHVRRDDLFVLPAEMTMDDFSDLLGESIVQESDSVLVVNPLEGGAPDKKAPSPETRPSVDAVRTMEPVRRPVQDKEKPAVVSLRTTAVPEKEHSSPSPMTTPAPITVVQRKTPKKAVKLRSPEDQAYDPFIGKAFLRAPETPAFLSGFYSFRDPSLSFVSGSGNKNDHKRNPTLSAF